MGIDGITEIKFPTDFSDCRGAYHEILNSKILPNFSINQVSLVTNKANVVRGMHGDWGTNKVVTVLDGEILQV